MLIFTIWRLKLKLPFKVTSPELANAAIFYGVYSRVARRLGVTPQHVRHVYIGRSVSERVSRELAAEINRIKKQNRKRAA